MHCSKAKLWFYPKKLSSHRHCPKINGICPEQTETFTYLELLFNLLLFWEERTKIGHRCCSVSCQQQVCPSVPATTHLLKDKAISRLFSDSQIFLVFVEADVTPRQATALSSINHRLFRLSKQPLQASDSSSQLYGFPWRKKRAYHRHTTGVEDSPDMLWAYKWPSLCQSG